MNPAKVDRNKLNSLTDLPNIGKAMALDLQLLGVHKPSDLCTRDAFQLYDDLCHLTQVKHDPCVIDVFMSVVSFMQGEPARSWWEFTPLRKEMLSRLHK